MTRLIGAILSLFVFATSLDAGGAIIFRRRAAAEAGGGGGLTLDATASGASGGSLQTSVSFSHTMSSDSNGALFVCVGIQQNNGQTATAVTYNGVSMTKHSEVFDDYSYASLWRLVAPATGSNTVAVTVSPSAHFAVGSISFTGVDQTTPLGTASTANNFGASTSVSPASSVGDIVIDCLARVNTAALTVGSGQTERVNQLNGAGGIDDNRTAISTEDGAATSTTMSWSWTGDLDYAQIGAAVNPS